MSDMETARIVITRVLTEDGDDRHFVAASDMSLVEALGMLRLAEDSLIQFPPGEGSEDGEHL